MITPSSEGLIFQNLLWTLAYALLGMLFLGSGVFLLLSLLSYSPLDLSWNTGADTLPQNWMGPSGAIISDLFIQGLGWVSYLAVGGCFSIGLMLLKKRSFVSFGKKVGALILGLIGTSVGATFFSSHAGGALGFLALLGCPWIATPWGYSFLWTVSGGLLLGAWGIRVTHLQQLGLWFRIGFHISTFYIRRFLRGMSVLFFPQRPTQRRAQSSVKNDLSPLTLTISAEAEDGEAPSPLPEQKFSFSALKKAYAEQSKSRHEGPTLQKSPFDCSKNYTLPPLALLRRPEGSTGKITISSKFLEAQARMLHQVLGDFGIKGQIGAVNPGPVVTLYELEPAAGLKSSRVIGLADDIARSMSAVSARVAIVPGRNVIGIELPNTTREGVLLRELLEALEDQESEGKLALALGKDIAGKPIIADLARMPHLLVAGTTGSGKSVGINAMILSLIYRLPPERCRFIMIDPKMLELSVYDGIPHLLTPVVTDPKKAVIALKWTVREMENRYRAMSQLGVRNIEGYNKRVLEALAHEEALKRTVQVGFDTEGKPLFEDQPLKLAPLPFIVVVVDEMADLMLVAGKEIESTVQRLAQMARAAGIHLIMATQRPSVDVITGTIKANFPTRISFQVTSKIDSRTILGEQGAEQLLGQGDMLYMAAGGRIVRVHGPFVSDQEVEKVVGFLKEQGEPSYALDLLEAFEGNDKTDEWGEEASGGQDDLYRQAVDIVLRHRKASTSYVQRQLQIGYNRAARLIERMENEGIVSPANHAGKRDILVSSGREERYG